MLSMTTLGLGAGSLRIAEPQVQRMTSRCWFLDIFHLSNESAIKGAAKDPVDPMIIMHTPVSGVAPESTSNAPAITSKIETIRTTEVLLISFLSQMPSTTVRAWVTPEGVRPLPAMAVHDLVHGGDGFLLAVVAFFSTHVADVGIVRERV